MYSAQGLRAEPDDLGIHPETARRIDLDRLDHFELERIPASDGIYCFYGRSRAVPADERIFVLADARSRSPDDGREAALHLPAFEHAFYEATRALRTILGERDPERRLQWNRIALFVAPAIYLDPDVAQRLARRLAPATRHLGIEKVVVRLSLLDRDAPERPPRSVEFVISDLTGSNMEIRQREPRTERLEPSSAYERKVVEARRRRLVYPVRDHPHAHRQPRWARRRPERRAPGRRLRGVRPRARRGAAASRAASPAGPTARTPARSSSA